MSPYIMTLVSALALAIATAGTPHPARPTIADLPAKTAITVGGLPDFMVTGGGSLWVANLSLKEIERVDVFTNRVVARIAMPGVPAFLTYGFDSVWVGITVNYKGASLVRVDAKTNRIVAKLAVRPSDPEGSVTASGDSIWMVTADGLLSRIDPATNSVRQKIRVAGGSAVPAYGSGVFWVTSSPANSVTAVDAKSGTILAKIPIPNKPHFMATGGGAAWVVAQGDGSVRKIDAKTKKVVGVVRAGISGSGGNIAYADGNVWITLIGTPLTKIDATKSVLTGQWFGPGGDGLTFGYGSLWLTDQDRHMVWRLDPARIRLKNS